MTDARVEARAGRVVAGAGAWPFALDCRSGAARLELNEGAVAVRPLRWHEKVTLARFAFLGVEVVDEQLLRLALPEGASVPGGDERDAALALALWVNDPGEGAPTLPLEPPLLASVTLEVCAAIGLAPSDLDGRDAAEVEALWHAAGGDEVHVAPIVRRGGAASNQSRTVEQPRPGRGTSTRAQHSATPSGVEVGEPTRIVIVPDEQRPARPEAASDEPAAGAVPVPSPTPVESETAVAPDPDVVADEPPAAPAQHVAPRAPSNNVLRAGSPEPPFEVSYHRPEAAAPRVTSPARIPVAVAATSPAPDPVRDNVLRGTGPAGVPRAFAPTAGAASTTPRAAARGPGENALPPPAPVDSQPFEVDLDEVIEELSERLGRAASELGVPSL